MTTLNLQVSASADDANQDATNAVSITDLTVVTDAVDEHVGLRFTNVTIPPGSTINDARLTVRISGTTANDEPQHRLRGELSANAAAFTTGSNDIDARARTTAAVDWDSADLGASGNDFQWGAPNGAPTSGANLSAIIQEIINQGGWASGNALVLIFEQHTGNALRDLGIVLYDGVPANAARLSIDYTAPAAGGSVPAMQIHYQQMRA
jgi:hypothetical protein